MIKQQSLGGIGAGLATALAVAALTCATLTRAQEGAAVVAGSQVAEHNPRIDAILDTLSKENLDQSMNQLFGSDQQYFYPGFYSDRLTAQIDLEKMLSNRRSIKVLQEIEKLPVGDRPAKCRQLFVQALEAHTNAFSSCLKYENDHSSPKNEQSVLATKESLCTAMFITADIGQTDLLSTEFLQLDQVRRELEPRLVASKASHPDSGAWMMWRNMVPDNRFQVNALRLAAIRLPRNEEILKKFDEECASLKIQKSQIPIVPWNSRVALFDFIPEGPLDTNKVVLEFTAYDWDSFGNPNRSTHPTRRGADHGRNSNQGHRFQQIIEFP